MITVDGYRWDIPCDIKRQAEVRPSSISGMMLNRRYFNDVIATYLTYDVTLAVPTTMTSQYAELHDILTQPIGFHEFVLPYGEGLVTIVAKVDSIKDTYVSIPGVSNGFWRGISFKATSVVPTKEMGIDEVIVHGLPQNPSAAYDDADEEWY